MIKYVQSHLGKQLLTYFVVTSVLPLFILWLISSIQFTNQYEAQVKNQLRSLVDIRALQLQSLIDSSEFTLDHIFKENALENRLIAVLTIPGDWDSVIEILERELQLEVSRNLFEELVIYDFDGNIVAASNDVIDIPWEPSNPQNPHQVHLSFNSDTGEQPVFIVTVPILDREANQVGFLRGQLKTEALYQIIHGDTGFEDVSFMYSSDDEDQFFNDTDYSEHHTSRSKNTKNAYVDIVSNVMNNKAFWAFSRLDELDTVVVMEVPYHSALGAIENLNRTIVVVMVIAALSGIAIGVIVTRNVTEPITVLTHMANSIRRGDYTQRVKITSDNEIGQLGMAFNEMAERIQDLLRSLLTRESQLEYALIHERELVEMQSHFIRQTSHEFRTPISVISAAVQSLRDFYELMDEKQRKVRFKRIDGQIQHMTSMLDDILLIKKIEEGELMINEEQFDLLEFLKQMVTEFESINRKHKFVCEWSVGNFEITADKKLVRQIVNNLLSNAMKYSPANSTIWVKLDQHQQYARLSITDTGIGIPLNHRDKLFEAFQRAQNVGNIKGSGLGLSITKRAVEMHQGRITYMSEENKGTTFTVELPLD